MKHTCIAALVLSCSFAMGMPRNSFLASPATNKSSLIAQSVKSPVFERYRNFYLVDKSSLVYAFDKMYLKRLTQTHRVRVWRYTKRGYASNLQTLRKGTQVWMFNNTLGLLAECGNPLTMKLPKAPKPPKSSTFIISPPYEYRHEIIEQRIPRIPSVTAEVVIAPNLIMEPQIPVTPIFAPETPSILHPQKHNELAPFVNFLGAAYTFSQFQHHTQPPVREPSAMIGMMIGIGMFARHRIKKGGK